MELRNWDKEPWSALVLLRERVNKFVEDLSIAQDLFVHISNHVNFSLHEIPLDSFVNLGGHIGSTKKWS